MSYLIIGVIVGVLVAVVVVISKKDAQENAEMVARLSDEQKARLMGTEVDFVEKDAWVQEAMVAKIVDKGSKFNIRMLWYNKTLENNEYETITIADTSITKAEQDAHNLKVDDFVKMYIAPEKAEAKIRF